MSDATIRIPVEARDRLARIASSEGMSLRGYLSHLAETLLTSALTGKVRRVGGWNGWMGDDVRSDRWRCGG
ncbi:hypothetical protein [Streptomyces sp. NPDC088812]|uniref:hypothetical protein n=1 Tax=Streptomyces sp. NPDC088812 TaxID=3365905 RepID=UPI00380415E9